jgi:hypothetical protein
MLLVLEFVILKTSMRLMLFYVQLTNVRSQRDDLKLRYISREKTGTFPTNFATFDIEVSSF